MKKGSQSKQKKEFNMDLMNKILGGYNVFLLACLFLLAYLAGNNDYIEVKIAWTITFVLLGIGIILSIIKLVYMEQEKRRQQLISITLMLCLYGPLIIYMKFFR